MAVLRIHLNLRLEWKSLLGETIWWETLLPCQNYTNKNSNQGRGRYENNLTPDAYVDFHIDFMLVTSPVVATKYSNQYKQGQRLSSSQVEGAAHCREGRSSKHSGSRSYCPWSQEGTKGACCPVCSLFLYSPNCSSQTIPPTFRASLLVPIYCI